MNGTRRALVAAAVADGSKVYHGKAVWLQEPLREGLPLHDTNNADAAQRSRPIWSLTALSGLKAAGNGRAGGTINSLRASGAHPAELAIIADGRLETKVEARLLTRTECRTRRGAER